MKYRKVNLDAFSIVRVKKFASKENGENYRSAIWIPVVKVSEG
jgi:hypothetical protein